MFQRLIEATDTRGKRTRALLEDHLDRLNAVVADCTSPELVAMASRYSRKVSAFLDWPDLALWHARGQFGENGYGASIDSICEHASRCEPARYVERVRA